MGKIITIVGPMKAGKTTKLIELYKQKCIHSRCISINHLLDNRYGENKIVSHDNLSIDAICLSDLKELFNEIHKEKFELCEYIFINEAQFFSNLKIWCELISRVYKKNIVLCGLDLDYKREKFGELLDVYEVSNEKYRLFSKCNDCKKDAEYTWRDCKNTNQVLIGTKEYYPLCNECYNKNSKILNDDKLKEISDILNV